MGWGGSNMLGERLQPGDEIRVISPAASMSLIKGEQIKQAKNRLTDFGFRITYGKNVYVQNEMYSSSVEERITDLHHAFQDPKVKGILTTNGGYNSNQLLRYIDFDLIKNNPKIFCGFGDITALNVAIHHKTGLITYNGPHFSTFGMKHGLSYTLNSFLTAVTNDPFYYIEPSDTWSNDPWYIEEDEYTSHPNRGYLVIQEGEANGKLIGGNLRALNLLRGTEFMPPLKGAVLFIEDDEESHPFIFDRDLQALLHTPGADEIQALLIGKFQQGSKMTDGALKTIISSKQELKNIPVIANINIGHVDPFATIPIGATASITAKSTDTEIFVSI